nr:hypothetical protein [Pleurocapsa sp. FMAR1]
MPSHEIIDNRKQRLVDKINCILESSSAAHFAVSYFFILGFTAKVRSPQIHQATTLTNW